MGARKRYQRMLTEKGYIPLVKGRLSYSQMGELVRQGLQYEFAETVQKLEEQEQRFLRDFDRLQCGLRERLGELTKAADGDPKAMSLEEEIDAAGAGYLAALEAVAHHEAHNLFNELEVMSLMCQPVPEDSGVRWISDEPHHSSVNVTVGKRAGS